MFMYKVLIEFVEFMHPRLLLVSPATRLHISGVEGAIILGGACIRDNIFFQHIMRRAVIRSGGPKTGGSLTWDFTIWHVAN